MRKHAFIAQGGFVKKSNYVVRPPHIPTNIDMTRYLKILHPHIHMETWLRCALGRAPPPKHQIDSSKNEPEEKNDLNENDEGFSHDEM